MRKTTLLIMTIIPILLFHLPTNSLALPNSELDEAEEEQIEKILIFKDDLLEELEVEVPLDTEVEVIEQSDEYIKVKFLIDEEEFSGFITADDLQYLNVIEKNKSEDEQLANVEQENSGKLQNNSTSEGKSSNKPVERTEQDEQVKQSNNDLKEAFISLASSASLRGIALKNKTHVYKEQSRNSKVLKSYSIGQELKYWPLNDTWYSAVVIINGERVPGYIHKEDVDNLDGQAETIYGIGISSPINVYKSLSTSTKVLKSYKLGSDLKVTTYTENWYKARVRVKGKWEEGFIRKSDIGINLPTLRQYAASFNTAVYEKKSKSSKVLRSYAAGHLLRFIDIGDPDWYMAKVILNGKDTYGYIHKEDVQQEELGSLNGYVKHIKTNVYAKRSKASKVLKTYPSGHLLKFQPYNRSWYQARVRINGKWETGFIHKDDVDEELGSLYMYAQKHPTNVYASTSTSSKVLKKYDAGHILKFKPHNSNWYIARVKVNGKYVDGYIHKKDVDTKAPTLYGYGQIERTPVYSSTSKSSKVLKDYRAGAQLKYRPYDKNWYEATVIINGKRVQGFIAKSDVGDKVPTLKGIALKGTTSVYSKISRNSRVLKSYKSGRVLKFRPYNSSWYRATVIINGKAQKGYIAHSDVVISQGKKVVVDAGHGGSDPGATGNGLREKDITLDVAKRIQKLLIEAGFEVIMTRTTDKTVELKDRTSLANRKKADIFVSVHVNAGGGTGIETWMMSKGPEPEKSRQLAGYIQNQLVKDTKAKDRGVRDGNLHVNRESIMPSVLVELGFIDNKNDANKLKKSSYKQQLAKSIVKGILKYFL